jgi:LysR family transcriptional regulator, regulator for genes of the gallate degradation pathway
MKGAATDNRKLPSLRQVRAFLAAAEYKSINRAAQAVHLSQPALSDSLQKLEQTIGFSLLVRTNSGAFLTDDGDIFVLRARRFAERLEQLLDPNMDRHNPDVGLSSRIWQITLPQIRALITIAETGSFSLAAERLELSESSLGRSARDIESVLERTLFVRNQRGVTVTRDGTDAARHLRLALREIEYGIDEMAQHRGHMRGQLRIGTLPLVRTRILPRVINMLTERYADISVQIFDGTYSAMLSDLRSGTIDFLLGALRDPALSKDIVQHPIVTDHFAIVARKGHPILSREKITREDLVKYPWIVARHGTPLRKTIDALFPETDIRPRTSIETGSLVAIRGMLVESDQLTLLSRHQILFEEAAGLLAVVPFAIDQPGRVIGIAVRRDWNPTPLQQQFLSFFETAAHSSQDNADLT